MMPTTALTVPDQVAAALDRIAACEPDAALRARQRLAVVGERLNGSSWPEVAWRFSTLTNLGAPVEFAWSSRDAALRWTSEVAPPEAPDEDRLGEAVAVAFPEGLGAAAGRVVEKLTGLQRGTRLRFGAWAGMRHRADSDEGKVYAEVPSESLRAMAARLGLAHSVVDTAGLTARMAGVTRDGSVEIYARHRDADEALVRGFEKCVFRRDDRLWPAVRALVRDDRLPQPCGMSVTFAPAGEPIALSWFTFAKAVHPSDAATVDFLVANTASPRSRAVLAALAAGRDDGRRRCGLVGVGVVAGGDPWLQVGLRPT